MIQEHEGGAGISRDPTLLIWLVFLAQIASFTPPCENKSHFHFFALKKHTENIFVQVTIMQTAVRRYYIKGLLICIMLLEQIFF